MQSMPSEPRPLPIDDPKTGVLLQLIINEFSQPLGMDTLNDIFIYNASLTAALLLLGINQLDMNPLERWKLLETAIKILDAEEPLK